jgi:hypothetical protein
MRAPPAPARPTRPRPIVLLGVLLGALLFSAPVVQAAQATPDVTWAVTLTPSPVYSGPSTDATRFGTVPAMTTFQILGYDGDFARVVNPRSQEVAYIASTQLAPGDPPSRWVTMPSPPMAEQFSSTSAVVTERAPLAYYPTTDESAAERALAPSTWINLTGTVELADGARWYRTAEGDFVPAEAVFVPARTEEYAGRWLDVNLSTPARVTAYDGDTRVRSFLTIKGAPPRPTPTGVFTILYRVANETMNSDTIGIPRFGPGGYYLTNVLFTQYFTGDGASFHYNYWSSAFGYAGSHGCLGLTYNDSAWLWGWATYGTPVSIHF